MQPLKANNHQLNDLDRAATSPQKFANIENGFLKRISLNLVLDDNRTFD